MSISEFWPWVSVAVVFAGVMYRCGLLSGKIKSLEQRVEALERDSDQIARMREDISRIKAILEERQ